VMENDLVTIDVQHYDVAQVQSSDSSAVMRMIEKAMSTPDFDVDKMMKLMDMKDRLDAAEAKRAFVAAVADFKRNPPTVYKDKENSQYKSKYTTIGNMVNTINSALSQHGLSANWNIDQADKIKVTCVLTHKLGHSDSTSMSAPPDQSGAKNPLQQIKSTVTYLKLATYEAITGIASSDGNADDDGNGSSQSEEKTKALPVISGKAFDKAIASVKGGTYTAAEIRKYYALTADQDTVLTDVEKDSK
jgi:hypothetical protein